MCPPPPSVLIENADTVWRTVVRIVGDQEIARDCYQQTFLDAMRLDSMQIRNWRAVLRKIATRQAMDALRRIYRQQEQQSFADSIAPLDLPPERRLMHQELRESVRRVLAGLPDIQATAFWLRHIENLEPQEIAKQLSIAPGYVRVLVHRAVMQLRRELGPVYDCSLNEVGDEA